jgi:hypothetical protein
MTTPDWYQADDDDSDRARSNTALWRDRGAIIAAQQTRIAQLEAQVADLRSLDGWVIGAADKHREDTKRGGCTCGFCAWSPEHVAIMSYLEAVGR